MTPARIFFMMAHRRWPNPNPVLVETVARLRDRGAAVDVGVGEESLIDLDALSAGYDLYVLKSKSAFWANVAGALHARGARILDPYETRRLTGCKVHLYARLRDAGIPTPRTWIAGSPASLEALAGELPLIVKPAAGGLGQGIHVVRDRDALRALPDFAHPVVVQAYLPHRPEDVKIYVIGERAFGFRKAFDPESFKRPGRPCDLPPALRDMALACGAACGASLYGVDLIETPAGPFVVDLNGFPSYRAIPEAPQLLAAHILRAAQR